MAINIRMYLFLYIAVIIFSTAESRRHKNDLMICGKAQDNPHLRMVRNGSPKRRASQYLRAVVSRLSDDGVLNVSTMESIFQTKQPCEKATSVMSSKAHKCMSVYDLVRLHFGEGKSTLNNCDLLHMCPAMLYQILFDCEISPSNKKDTRAIPQNGTNTKYQRVNHEPGVNKQIRQSLQTGENSVKRNSSSQDRDLHKETPEKRIADTTKDGPTESKVSRQGSDNHYQSQQEQTILVENFGQLQENANVQNQHDEFHGIHHALHNHRNSQKHDHPSIHEHDHRNSHEGHDHHHSQGHDHRNSHEGHDHLRSHEHDHHKSPGNDQPISKGHPHISVSKNDENHARNDHQQSLHHVHDYEEPLESPQLHVHDDHQSRASSREHAIPGHTNVQVVNPKDTSGHGLRHDNGCRLAQEPHQHPHHDRPQFGHEGVDHEPITENHHHNAHQHDSDVSHDTGRHSEDKHHVSSEVIHHHFPQVPLKVWGCSLLAVFIISLVGVMCVAVVPIIKKVFFNSLTQFLVALAVGTLSGDAFLHLLPHALSGEIHSNHGDEDSLHSDHHGSHDDAVWKGLCGLAGIMVFFITERLLIISNNYRRRRKQMPKRACLDGLDLETTVGRKLSHHAEPDRPELLQYIRSDSAGEKHELMKEHEPCHTIDLGNSRKFSEKSEDHGHSHTPGSSASVAVIAWMVIAGDGIHNLCDGLAVGAAFSNSITGGVSTSIAIFCHELPHEIGDFAVLLQSGMSVKHALMYNVVSSILCLLGMVIGVIFGNMGQASLWIFACIAGMFLYMALVDVLPQMMRSSLEEDGNSIYILCCHVCGIVLGAAIMAAIAFYEDKLMLLIDL